MKGKWKAAATPTMALSDDGDDGKKMVEVPVLGGNIDEGNQTHGFDYSGENPDEREEGEEDEEGNEEEADDEGKGDDEGEEEFEGEGLGEEERPKLDEGFYEIEAIRRKRVRKGQLQYLIKWRGWPETSNTWEPLENLESCSDVIEAFEESLRCKSSRKRKRKHGGPHILSKKKQQLSSTGYNITGHEGENNGNVSITKTAKQTDENGHNNGSKQNFDKQVHTNGSKENFDKEEDNEYDPKLSELKGTLPTNDVNADKLAVNFGEGNSSGGDGLMNGVPKLDYVDPIQNKACTGAKRRKSGSVKRFKKELATYEPACVQSSPIFSQPSPLNVTADLGGETAPLGIEHGTLSGANSSYKPVGENSLVITKIIKPIGFSASLLDNTQEALVSFVALRSDGEQVEVDNKYLRSHNPNLLIDFYEQHLKYSTL
ncbi:chromo domain-containing protein LHP1 isoform X2 [Euphorbia lathyris]|uniref:chromo domain-containing protein LHP1 isoform X2 n=1 Tax=Euphorbia lathyris TaxID=212925 RepID=UPI003313B6FB